MGALFVGRLSDEKGIALLISLAHMGIAGPIEVVGTGPRESEVRSAPGMNHLGWLDQKEVHARMQAAGYLLVPSICYETFGLVVVEAFGNATPVIASRIGALAEAVADGETGLLFEPGNVRDLAEKVAWANAHPAEMRRMGASARREYERRYAPEANYDRLMEIYRDALRVDSL
jgi:glycosyltransferase involved in cell wall biosynthesis